MFGRIAQAIDRNVIICLTVVAAVLLLTGLVIAIADPPSARAQPGTAQPLTARPGPERAGPAAP